MPSGQCIWCSFDLWLPIIHIILLCMCEMKKFQWRSFKASLCACVYQRNWLVTNAPLHWNSEQAKLVYNCVQETNKIALYVLKDVDQCFTISGEYSLSCWILWEKISPEYTKGFQFCAIFFIFCTTFAGMIILMKIKIEYRRKGNPVQYIRYCSILCLFRTEYWKIMWMKLNMM